jgi:hypothetical protein
LRIALLMNAPIPAFTFTADDPLAGLTLELYAAIRERDETAMLRVLDKLTDAADALPPPASEQMTDVLRRAEAMHAYRTGRPYCFVCGCTEEIACLIHVGNDRAVCQWANAEQTVCTNPACLHATAANPPTPPRWLTHDLAPGETIAHATGSDVSILPEARADFPAGDAPGVIIP